MTRHVDFRLQPDDFTRAAFEMARLAQLVPDGPQQLLAFNARMQASANPADYLVRRGDVVDGLPVVVSAPGPKTLEFMIELRSAAAREGNAPSNAASA